MVSQRLITISLSANFLLAGVIGGILLSRAGSPPAAISVPASPIAENRAPGIPSARPSRPPQASPVENQTLASAPAARSPRQPATSSSPSAPAATGGAWQYPAALSSSSRGGGSRTSGGATSSQAQYSASASVSSVDEGAPANMGAASVPSSYGYAAISTPGQTVSGGAAASSVDSTDGVVPVAPVRSITGNVQPDGEGNSFVDKGQKVAVADSPPAADGGTTQDLSLTVTPDSGGTSSDSTSAGERPAAFTQEQDLFRAKWGWSAYGQAERAAWDVALGHAQ